MDNFTARSVWFDDTRVYVGLNNGRVVESPLAWLPRLQYATVEQRNRFELVSGGYGIRWERLDEYLTAEGFLTYSKK